MWLISRQLWSYARMLNSLDLGCFTCIFMLLTAVFITFHSHSCTWTHRSLLRIVYCIAYDVTHLHKDRVKDNVTIPKCKTHAKLHYLCRGLYYASAFPICNGSGLNTCTSWIWFEYVMDLVVICRGSGYLFLYLHTNILLLYCKTIQEIVTCIQSFLLFRSFCSGCCLIL